MSLEAQTQMAAEDASQEYDLQTRPAVLGISMRHTTFGYKFERCFKAELQLVWGQPSLGPTSTGQSIVSC